MPKVLTADASHKEKWNAHLVIFLTVLIDMIGFGIVIPILPLYALNFHATPWQEGLLLGVFSLMQLIFAPILGRWSDRVGRRPVLLVSIIGTGLGFLVLGLANSLILLFLGRIIDGISGGNVSTAQAYLADITKPEKRSAVMGMIGGAFGLGFVFGPAIGGLLGHYSVQLPFYVAAALSFANAVMTYFMLPESLPEESRSKNDAYAAPIWKKVTEAKDTPLGGIMLCALLSTAAFALVTALYTLFTQNRLHWAARENGLMFTYIGFVAIIIQGWLVRKLVKTKGEKPLILFGTVCLFLAMALLPASSNFWLIVLASTLLAVGNGFVTPMLSGLASKTADAQSQGVVMGIMQSVASFARMIGPMLGGVLLNYDFRHHFTDQKYGITPYWASALVMLLAIVAAMKLQPVDHTVHISAPEPVEA